MKRRTESETGFQILIITTEGNFYQFDKKCLLSFQQNITFEDSNDLILAADIFDNVIVALSCHAVYCGLLNKSSLIPLQNIIRLINRSTTRQIDQIYIAKLLSKQIKCRTHSDGFIIALVGRVDHIIVSYQLYQIKIQGLEIAVQLLTSEEVKIEYSSILSLQSPVLNLLSATAVIQKYKPIHITRVQYLGSSTSKNLVSTYQIYPLKPRLALSDIYQCGSEICIVVSSDSMQRTAISYVWIYNYIKSYTINFVEIGDALFQRSILYGLNDRVLQFGSSEIWMQVFARSGTLSQQVLYQINPLCSEEYRQKFDRFGQGQDIVYSDNAILLTTNINQIEQSSLDRQSDKWQQQHSEQHITISMYNKLCKRWIYLSMLQQCPLPYSDSFIEQIINMF